MKKQTVKINWGKQIVIACILAAVVYHVQDSPTNTTKHPTQEKVITK